MNILEDRDIVITHVIMACLSKALPDRDNDVYTHTRRYHGLILRLRGSTVYEIGGRPRVSCPGDIILITKGTRYTLSDRTGGECLVVNFETFDEYDQNVIFLHPKNTAFYDGLFRREIRLGRNKDFCMMKSILYEILSNVTKLSDELYGTLDMKRKLEPAIRRFDQCFTDPLADLSVGSLAELCGMSGTYFRKLFHAVYGTTPGKFFMARRLDRAKEALASGLRVCDAAAEAGFDDPSYFVKVFRRETGVLPGKYQREPI